MRVFFLNCKQGEYMRVFFSFLVFLNCIVFYGFAQKDSLSLNYQPRSTFIKKQILPIGLITTGALLNIGTIKNSIDDKIPHTNTNIDDYFEYIPMAQMYMFDILGFKHQNSVFDQTKYLLISQFTSSLLVHTLKKTTKLERPRGGNNSFPSGHTTNAFVGATVLFHEFKDSEPLLAYSGYVFAAATGVLRMTNDDHWLPDVLAGAGIGILTANLVYHFKPLKNFQPFKKKKDITAVPMVSPNSVGLVCRF